MTTLWAALPCWEAGTRTDPDGVQGGPGMGNNFLRRTIWQTVIRKYCEKQPNWGSCLGNQLSGTMRGILCLEEKWHKIHHIHITQRDKLNDGDKKKFPFLLKKFDNNIGLPFCVQCIKTVSNWTQWEKVQTCQFQTSGLQNGEKTNFNCFKPSSLWYLLQQP